MPVTRFCIDASIAFFPLVFSPFLICGHLKQGGEGMTDFIHWLFAGPRHDSFTTFNREDGYLEAIVRGFRSTILDQNDYANLCQCETLEDMKIHLSQTDYADVLQNEGGVITPAILKERWFVPYHIFRSFLFSVLF